MVATNCRDCGAKLTQARVALDFDLCGSCDVLCEFDALRLSHEGTDAVIEAGNSTEAERGFY